MFARLVTPTSIITPHKRNKNLPTTSPVWHITTQTQRGQAGDPAGKISISLYGIPYKVYKNCPRVLKLRTLMRITWAKQSIPSEWQRAVAVSIPKQQNAKTIEQFRSIALLNVEGKIFFSVMARRMTTYLTGNNYIDTSCQKAGVLGFPGCVELLPWFGIRFKAEGVLLSTLDVMKPLVLYTATLFFPE